MDYLLHSKEELNFFYHIFYRFWVNYYNCRIGL